MISNKEASPALKAVFLLSLVLMLFQGVFAQTVPQYRAGGIEAVYLARDDGEGNAGEQVTEFGTTDIPIYCVVLLDSTDAAVVKMNFVAVRVSGVKPETKVVTASYTTTAGENRVNFTGRPHGRWTPGLYRVDILLDGKMARDMEFEIKARQPTSSAVRSFQAPAARKLEGKNAQKESAQKDNRTDEATAVQKGVLTARQKEHSKLYKGRSLDSKKLTDISKEDFTLTIGSEGRPVSSDLWPNLTDFIREKTCESDAIIVGKVTKRESQLTEEGDFIFTDYTVTLETILKVDDQQTLKHGEKIIVTGAGGVVRIDGQTLSVVEYGKDRPHVGSKYLLFLRQVPATTSYVALDGSGLISESDGEIQRLTNVQRGEFLPGTNIGPVTDLIKTYAAKQCGGKP